MRELEEARDDYVHAYPSLVSASERDLGELFDRSQYPTPDKIKELFKATVTFWPVPESNHFIAEISDKAAKEAKKGIESEIESRLIEAAYDMVRRARVVVSELIEKLENAKTTEIGGLAIHPNGKLQSVIRDSLIDNISETADLIEKMNLTNNREIKKVIRDLRRLTGFSPYRWRQEPRIFGSKTVGKPAALEIANEVMMNLVRLDLKDQEVDAMIEDTSDYME